MSIQSAINIIAAASIYHSGIKPSDNEYKEEVYAEEARIERMIEHFYHYDKEANNIHYEEYVKNFLKNNFKKIIDNHPEFSGGFLSDFSDYTESDVVQYNLVLPDTQGISY